MSESPWERVSARQERRVVPGGWMYRFASCDGSDHATMFYPARPDEIERREAEAVRLAVHAERARCARIVRDEIDGGEEMRFRPHVDDSLLSEMIREIEGGK